MPRAPSDHDRLYVGPARRAWRERYPEKWAKQQAQTEAVAQIHRAEMFHFDIKAGSNDLMDQFLREYPFTPTRIGPDSMIMTNTRGLSETEIAMFREKLADGWVPPGLTSFIFKAFEDHARSTLTEQFTGFEKAAVVTAVSELVANISKHRAPAFATVLPVRGLSIGGHPMEQFFGNLDLSLRTIYRDLPGNETISNALDAFYEADDAGKKAFFEAVDAMRALLKAGNWGLIQMAWDGAAAVVDKILGPDPALGLADAVTTIKTVLPSAKEIAKAA